MNLVDVAANEDEFENVHITLMIKKMNNNEIFATKVLCSETVAKKEWLNNYTMMLDDKSWNNLLNKLSNKFACFNKSFILFDNTWISIIALSFYELLL